MIFWTLSLKLMIYVCKHLLCMLTLQEGSWPSETRGMSIIYWLFQFSICFDISSISVVFAHSLWHCDKLVFASLCRLLLKSQQILMVVATRSLQSSGWKLRYLDSLDKNVHQFCEFYYLEMWRFVWFFSKASREEANSALDQLHVAMLEVKSLKITTQRMILTHDEMVSTG